MTLTYIEGDRMEHERFCLIAEKIEADPTLLLIPLENINRWMSRGHHARKPLEKWASVIREAQHSPEGMAQLIQILRDDSEEARFFKGFEPFPGVLNADELDRFSWTSRH